MQAAGLFALSALLVESCSAQLFPDGIRNGKIISKRETIGRKKYRPIYHISAHLGWLNDPTGFIKFRSQYHVFYLYHPYSGAWGQICWGHVVSENLIDWTHYPPALIPNEQYEKHGCLGGSVLIHNDYLTLFYTGHTVSNNSTKASQNMAISSDGVIFQKYLYNPVLKSDQEIGGFKSPKVWRYRNSWYMIIGGMTPKKHGQLLMKTSPDMFHWQSNGTLAQSYGDMGFLWENPDLFELDDMHVLMFCARGIQTDGNLYRNLYQAGYVVGKFDPLKGIFLDDFEISTATYNILDYGHDFYAPQTLLDSDGRRLLIAWLGMWDSSFKEATEGWASLLTVVRELNLDKNGKILMKPARELVDLRTEILEDAWYSPGETFDAGSKAFELIVNSSGECIDCILSLEWGTGRFVIHYNARLGYIAIDRGGEDGLRRADWSPAGDLVSWRIFFDHSAVELFCGEGEVVFSSRIYPPRTVNIKIGGDTVLHILQYRLRSGGYEQFTSPYFSPARRKRRHS